MKKLLMLLCVLSVTACSQENNVTMEEEAKTQNVEKTKEQIEHEQYYERRMEKNRQRLRKLDERFKSYGEPNENYRKKYK